MRRLSIVSLIALIIASAPLARGQSHTGSQMKTYVRPNGDFQFRYPDFLVDCNATPNDLSCAAYMPVCDGTTGHSVMCAAYPKNRIKEQQTFDGAAFVVAIVEDAHDEKSCHAIPDAPPDTWAHPHAEKINGAEFWVTHNGAAAMSHYEDMAIYRTLHNGICYEVNINVSGINPMVYPNPPKSFDKKSVEKPLQQALRTFQFLK